MDHESSNPITERLTRGVHARSARWIGAGAALTGLLCTLVSFTIMASRPGAGFIPWVVIALAVLIALTCLPASLVAAAVIVGRFAAKEDFALLRLTGLPGKTVVEGYVEGVLVRLRLYRAISLWFPPAAALGVAGGALFSMPDSFRFQFLVWIALIMLGTVYLVVMSASLIRIGVAISIRWTGNSPAVAGAIATGLVALVIVPALALVVIPANPMPAIYCGIGFFYMPVVLKKIQDAVLDRAARFIDRSVQVGE